MLSYNGDVPSLGCSGYTRSWYLDQTFSASGFADINTISTCLHLIPTLKTHLFITYLLLVLDFLQVRVTFFNCWPRSIHVSVMPPAVSKSEAWPAAATLKHFGSFFHQITMLSDHGYEVIANHTWSQPYAVWHASVLPATKNKVFCNYRHERAKAIFFTTSAGEEHRT